MPALSTRFSKSYRGAMLSNMSRTRSFLPGSAEPFVEFISLRVYGPDFSGTGRSVLRQEARGGSADDIAQGDEVRINRHASLVQNVKRGERYVVIRYPGQHASLAAEQGFDGTLP